MVRTVYKRSKNPCPHGVYCLVGEGREEKFSSVRSCPTLCDPMDCSMPGFPVHHQLLELAQTHVHWVNDAIQPSHPLSSPSLPAFNLSQHQGLFQWVSSMHQVAKTALNEAKNWCFQIVVLQKTLESPLDRKDSGGRGEVRSTQLRTSWIPDS